MGLAITKRLVSAHHGRIWVETELGEGSEFHVVLPLENPALLEMMNADGVVTNA